MRKRRPKYGTHRYKDNYNIKLRNKAVNRNIGIYCPIDFNSLLLAEKLLVKLKDYGTSKFLNVKLDKMGNTIEIANNDIVIKIVNKYTFKDYEFDTIYIVSKDLLTPEERIELYKRKPKTSIVELGLNDELVYNEKEQKVYCKREARSMET